MIRPNPGGIVSRNPLPMQSFVPKSKIELGSSASSTHYANNVNVTKGKRGITALGRTNMILDQSLHSENQNITRYSMLKKSGKS